MRWKRVGGESSEDQGYWRDHGRGFSACCLLSQLVDTVLVAAPLCVVVVLVVVLPLDACAVHGYRGHQAFGLVTAAAEARLETIFKFLAHKIKSYWVDTRIHGCQVNTDVIHKQQEAKQFTSVLVHLVIHSFLQNTAQVEREPAKRKNNNQAENCLGHFPTLFEMFAEGNPQAAIPSVQHLTSHEGIEDCGAHQWHTEIEAKEPPVLYILVELHEF